MNCFLNNYHWIEFLSICAQSACVGRDRKLLPASCLPLYCGVIQELWPTQYMLTSSDLCTLCQHLIHTKTAVPVLGHV